MNGVGNQQRGPDWRSNYEKQLVFMVRVTVPPKLKDLLDGLFIDNILNYRKIPKISPSMYNPLQILAPQTPNAKYPPLNHPSKYKPPRGLVLGNIPQIQSKSKQKR